MKIVVLSHISDLVGGAEMSLMNLLDYWSSKTKIQPHFVIRKPVGTLADEIKKRGWTYLALDYGFWSEAETPTDPEIIYKNSAKNLKAVLDIQNIITEQKPDFVMTNSVVCPWAALAAYQLQVPHVWFVREYGDLDHGRMFEIGREQTFQDVSTTSSLVVANSKTLANHLKQYCDPKKVTAVYTPFDIEALQKKAQAKVTSPYRYPESLKLVITGNLAPSKGQISAIQSTIDLNKKGYLTELCILGGKAPNDFMMQIQDLIKQGGVEDKVHLMGFHKNPMAYVRLADVGIMASRMEAFGRVTFEYIALGKAVVGSNSGATPEMVKPEVNGYLYEVDKPSTLTDALQHYAQDKTLAAKHGEASRKMAADMLDGKYSADKLLETIKVAITRKPTYSRPLNFTQRMYEYSQVAAEYISKTKTVSVKKLAVERLKGHTKTKARQVKQIGRRVLKK